MLYFFYQNLITKNNDITYINPTVFYTYGYTTFLNYVAICDEVVKGIAYNLSMGKSVNTCKNLDCDFFTKSNLNYKIIIKINFMIIIEVKI